MPVSRETLEGVPILKKTSHGSLEQVFRALFKKT
jgi:hypothetical protein